MVKLVKDFIFEEDGVGVVEVILILVNMFTNRNVCISCILRIYRLMI
jgi:hypothetical protein